MNKPKFKIEPEDDAEDGCCMCELCWQYGWHRSAPWYGKLWLWIRNAASAKAAVFRQWRKHFPLKGEK